MKLPSWLSTCSSSKTSTCISTVSQVTKPITMSPTPTNRRKLLLSDTSIFSDSQMSSSSISQDSNLTNSSLESNLSILTLPSVPSLQKLSLDSLNLSVSGVCIVTLKPRPAAHVNCLAVNQNLLYAVSGNKINVFDLFTFSILDTFNVHDPSSGFIKSIAFLDEKVFTAHQDCKIRVWMINRPDNQHKHIATLPTLEDRVKNFIFPSNHIKVRRNRKKLWVEHFDAVSGLAVTHDLLSSISWDKYLKIWIAPNFRCGASVKAHDDAINAVVISPDGTIYTGSADTRIKVWGRPFEERKLVLIATLEKHKSAVNALALNSDGSVLFSGACDRSILVWEREDSANHMVVTGALRGHSKAILCLINVSELLISGSADRTVRIWKRGFQGKFCCLTVLDGHVKPVRSLVAVAVPAPENEESYGEVKVISGSFDGEIKVWKVMLSSIITR